MLVIILRASHRGKEVPGEPMTAWRNQKKPDIDDILSVQQLHLATEIFYHSSNPKKHPPTNAQLAPRPKPWKMNFSSGILPHRARQPGKIPHRVPMRLEEASLRGWCFSDCPKKIGLSKKKIHQLQFHLKKTHPKSWGPMFWKSFRLEKKNTPQL